jgi:hypothetical protein
LAKKRRENVTQKKGKKKEGEFFPTKKKGKKRQKRQSNYDSNDDDDESFTPIFATLCLARPQPATTKDDTGLRRRGGVECRFATNDAFNEAMAASETMDANPRFERVVVVVAFDDGGGVLGREREQRGWRHDKLAFVEI